MEKEITDEELLETEEVDKELTPEEEAENIKAETAMSEDPFTNR